MPTDQRPSEGHEPLGGDVLLSFVVRIWTEEPVDEAGESAWRGHVTHLPSGKQRYVSELTDITAFIMDYLPGAR